jgi:hypothetical protein
VLGIAAIVYGIIALGILTSYWFYVPFGWTSHRIIDL